MACRAGKPLVHTWRNAQAIQIAGYNILTYYVVSIARRRDRSRRSQSVEQAPLQVVEERDDKRQRVGGQPPDAERFRVALVTRIRLEHAPKDGMIMGRNL